MAGLKEIQNRIKSIENTRKITNAMYMISSTKMKKARRDLEATEPYFYTLQNMVSRIMRHLPEIQSVYFDEPGQTKHNKIGLLVVSGDKGLAGAYNHNVLKLAQKFLDEKENTVKLYVVGELGRQYFTQRHIPIAQNFTYTAQNPTFNRARWISETLLNDYLTGEIDELHIIYTRLENSLTTQADDIKLLPLEKPVPIQVPMDVYHEIFYLIPSDKEALDTIIPNYITGYIYGGLVEAFCSEQNDRMMAMDSATKNADKLLHDLSVMYNRARQAAITQEITEVCAGAKAQKKKSIEKAKKKAAALKKIGEDV